MAKMATVWDRTTEFLSDNLASLLPLALLTIFLPNSVQANLSQVTATATPALKLMLSLVMVALALVTLWGKLAITAIATGSAGDRPLALALQRLLPAIGVLALAGLIALVLLAPAAAVLAAYGVDFSPAAAAAQPVVPDAAKPPLAVALLIPLPIAIWLLARVYVLLSAVVVAERRGAGAIRRAFALSRGLAWRIVGVMILYLIVAGVCELAAKAAFGTIFELVVGGNGPLSLAKILTSIVSGAVSCAFAVLATVFCAKLYLATRGQDDLSPT